jgi:hypothetical protein
MKKKKENKEDKVEEEEACDKIDEDIHDHQQVLYLAF